MMSKRRSTLDRAQPRKLKPTAPEVVKGDAKGQFVRRRSGGNPSRNPDGLHSANPVVLSDSGDATQPVKDRQNRDDD